MSKNLVIVESATKTKTIKKYLGKDFQILASYGHVRDLLPKEGAVDPDNNFAMKYQAIEKNAKHLESIRKAVKTADTLYLATDPDREGEAISWHILEDLKEKKLIKDKKVYRVAFNEITKRAVQEAIDNPRELSMDLVNAQQARRALDYLVGFNLSPLLWKKIRRGLSAGRVQSPALRMIVEREDEIEAFKSREYWSIEADANSGKQSIIGKLTRYQGEKITQFSVTNDKQANEIQSTLLKAANGNLVVTEVEKKQRKRRPAAPFITSTLQQEAARKLGYTAQRTMRIAQQLYEGIDVGSGSVGLITYMRTDSVTLAQDALTEIRDFISKRYGKDNLPAKPNVYKTKSKNAQEAHEAIRPTHVDHIPDEIKQSLTNDQYKLYNLIWKRAVACQMIHATINTVGVNLAAGENNTFRTTGSTIANPGFMAVYLEGVDDSTAENDEKMLPTMAVGDKLELLEIRPEQHFTEPPPRFSEASLIKALEENDLGRPSTYATIISTLQAREYVTLEKKRFQPTDVGRVVSKFLTNYFSKYVDYGFTAQLEDELDAVSRGEKEWIPLMTSFWEPFKSKVDDIEKNVDRKDVTQEALDEECPKCKKHLSIRLGRRGRFIGCSGYPECDYTRNMDGEEQEPEEPEVVEGRSCPQCEEPLIIRTGRYGKFIGCSTYPKCKHMEPLEAPADTGVQCPECKQSTLLKRKSRYGKIFYSCSRYPDCKYAVWNTPVAEPCPKCEWPVLTIKTTKRRGTEKVCPQKACDFSEPYELKEEGVSEET
ncbi:MAG: type I DNA topoisomerase [Gammaproteobacteria bacterium]|nr:type I DNA topoisomerase [Gammaproteobacteria bacterium]